MARPIILAMEEYEGTDPNDLDFSDFEPVMDPSETNSAISDLESTIDAISDLGTHTEITEIIATEGVGNTPQIAAIALSALETRLFGQPVVGSRIGTESRTRIATEGKNVFVRVWQAIVKFFTKIWNRLKSLFSGGKKSGEKKSKEIKKAKVGETIKATDKLNTPKAKDMMDSGKKPTREEVKEATGDSNDEAAKAFVNALHLSTLIRKDINLFSRDGVGPVELLSKNYNPYVHLDENTWYDDYEEKIVDSLEKYLDLLSDYHDSLEKGNPDESKIQEAENDELEENVNKILECFNDLYVPSFKEFKLFNAAEVRKTHFVKLTEADIANPRTPYIEHAKFILKEKDKVAKLFEDISNLGDKLDGYLDERSKKLKEISKVVDTINFSNDKYERVISNKLNLASSALLVTDMAQLNIIDSFIKFTDSLHRLIMMCDENKTQ